MQCKQKSGSVRLRGDTRFAYTVSAPMFAYLLIVLIIPVCWGLYISFTDKMIGSQGHFDGLKNYINLLKNGSFRNAVGNTVVYTVSTFIPSPILSSHSCGPDSIPLGGNCTTDILVQGVYSCESGCNIKDSPG